MTRAMVAICVSIFVLGCGSGSNTASAITADSGASYGTLEFSGSGSGLTGTSFGATTRLGVSNAGLSVLQWYNIDLAAGTSFPYVVVIITIDNGAVTSVQVSKLISSGVAAGQWVVQSVTALPQTSATANTVTLSNILVPGYAAASTTTSLTLNGTLRF